MKSSIEYKELRSDIISQLETIKDVASTEKRDLTTDENNQVDGLLTEVDNLDAMIERSEKMETIKRNSAVISGTKATKVEKEIRDYSFQDAARQAMTGHLSGLVKEMDQEARNEARYTGQNYRGVGIPSSVLTRANVDTAAQNSSQTMAFTDQLEANLVLAKAGANVYTGVNNMKFPVISGVNSGFFLEDGSTSALTPGGITSSITLSPKKIISVVNVSNESLVQNASLEAALRRNMAQNIAATLEDAVLTGGTDVTAAPESIFTDAIAASTAAFSGASASVLESTILGNGVQVEGARLAYLMNPTAYAQIKVAEQVSNVSAAYDMRDKTVNGYFAFQSANVANDATTFATKAHVLFGDFSKVHMAQFGGLDFLYDPYTGAATGAPRLVITSLVDCQAVQLGTGGVFANLIEA